MKIDIYIRVSTDRQASQGYSLEAQENTCRAYLNTHGYEVGKVLVDDGISGSIDLKDRPAGSQIYSRLISGASDGVIAISLSRLSRSTIDAVSFLEFINKHLKTLILLDLNIDTSTPIGKVVFSIVSALAQLEREQISERTRQTMASMRMQGRIIGNIPYGFVKALTDTKMLIKDPVEVKVVQQIFEMYDQGRSYRAIAKILTEQGIKTKMGNDVWSWQSIRSIINRRDFYMHMGVIDN